MYVKSTSFVVGISKSVEFSGYSKQYTSRFNVAASILFVPFDNFKFVNVYTFPCEDS